MYAHNRKTYILASGSSRYFSSVHSLRPFIKISIVYSTRYIVYINIKCDGYDFIEKITHTHTHTLSVNSDSRHLSMGYSTRTTDVIICMMRAFDRIE